MAGGQAVHTDKTIYEVDILGSSFARNLKVNPLSLGPEALAQPAVTGKIEIILYPWLIENKRCHVKRNS